MIVALNLEVGSMEQTYLVIFTTTLSSRRAIDWELPQTSLVAYRGLFV